MGRVTRETSYVLAFFGPTDDDERPIADPERREAHRPRDGPRFHGCCDGGVVMRAARPPGSQTPRGLPRRPAVQSLQQPDRADRADRAFYPSVGSAQGRVPCSPVQGRRAGSRTYRASSGAPPAHSGLRGRHGNGRAVQLGTRPWSCAARTERGAGRRSASCLSRHSITFNNVQ